MRRVLNPHQDAVCDYLRKNLSPMALRNKRPISEWKILQSERMTEEAALRLWKEPFGIGIICGLCSGNVEVIDCDRPEAFPEFERLVREQQPGLWQRLTIIKTPRGGFHLPYRCSEIGRNQDLALFLEVVPDESKLSEEERRKLVFDEQGRRCAVKKAFETRGEGGYIQVPGGGALGHDSGLPYTVIQGEGYLNLPTVTREERRLLLSTASSFTEYVNPDHSYSIGSPPTATTGSGLRPGDDFNSRGDLVALLESKGASIDGKHGNILYIRRPGKPAGHSATLHACGHNSLYCFSSDWTPFEQGKRYDAFSVRCLLDYGLLSPDTFSKTAKDLAAEGYGDPKWRDNRPPAQCETASTAQSEQIDRNASRMAQVISRILTEWGLSDESKVTFFALYGIFGSRKVIAISTSALGRHIHKDQGEQEKIEQYDVDSKAYRRDSQFGRRRLENLIEELRGINVMILTRVEKGGKLDPRTGKRRPGRYRLDTSIFKAALNAAYENPELASLPGGIGQAIERAATDVAQAHVRGIRGPIADPSPRKRDVDVVTRELNALRSLARLGKNLFRTLMDAGLTTGEIAFKWRHATHTVEELYLQKKNAQRSGKYQKTKGLRDGS